MRRHVSRTDGLGVNVIDGTGRRLG